MIAIYDGNLDNFLNNFNEEISHRNSHVIVAAQKGYFTTKDSRNLLSCYNRLAYDGKKKFDPYAGIVLLKTHAQYVKKGEELARCYSAYEISDALRIDLAKSLTVMRSAPVNKEYLVKIFS